MQHNALSIYIHVDGEVELSIKVGKWLHLKGWKNRYFLFLFVFSDFSIMSIYNFYNNMAQTFLNSKNK